MAFGDKTITFNQKEVQFLQQVVMEFMLEHDIESNPAEQPIADSILDKLRHTQAALS